MDDFMNEVERAAPKRRPLNRKAVSTGLGDAVDLRGKVDKAADVGHSKRHGKFVQFTMRLDSDVVEEIKRRADEFGIPHTHMYRWIVARGLLALNEGEEPEIEYQRVPKVKLP